MEHFLQDFNNIIKSLNEKQNIFEILTDEEYLGSEYKINNRKDNIPHENEIHVMIPGNKKHIIKIYANDWGIGFVVNHSFENFKSSIKCEQVPIKPSNPNTEFSFRIYFHKNGINDINSLYDSAITVAMELMSYAIELNPEYDPNNLWKY